MSGRFHPAVERARARWRSEPFAWGAADCIISVCDYLLDRTGIDPAAPWRGSYCTPEGAEAICLRHGAALGLMRHGMARAGFVPGEPVPGAAVVVDMFGHEITGIFLGGRQTMLRLEGRGLVDWPAPVLEAWPCA
ncbi:DUF6950 family protein [Salipiger marinus]|uniref:DUF6950 domain-containing protein n=1 Tax=Salipiger marinus TaxID=555512 RepID=A0A1G8PTM6_9RHOB|nr:hypothetical protein [Salipiger marinus]SDI95698.1 hypothetical protein SAMN04487993_1013104 [Salipiger marinus]